MLDAFIKFNSFIYSKYSWESISLEELCNHLIIEKEIFLRNNNKDNNKTIKKTLIVQEQLNPRINLLVGKWFEAKG